MITFDTYSVITILNHNMLVKTDFNKNWCKKKKYTLLHYYAYLCNTLHIVVCGYNSHV